MSKQLVTLSLYIKKSTFYFLQTSNFVIIIIKYNSAFNKNKMVQTYAKDVTFVRFLNIDDRHDATWLGQLFEIETIDCELIVMFVFTVFVYSWTCLWSLVDMFVFTCSRVFVHT